MILPIVVFPDPFLRKKCEKVTSYDDELRKLYEDMSETMYAADGIGISAIQVGVAKQMFLVDAGLAGRAGEPPLCFINPMIQVHMRPLVPRREEDYPRNVVMAEGCLSFPGVTRWVARLDRCVIIARDLTGARFMVEGSGMFARCLQHEFDHAVLGKLLIDYPEQRRPDDAE